MHTATPTADGAWVKAIALALSLAQIGGVVMLYASLQHRPGLMRSVAIALFTSLAFWLVGVPSFAAGALDLSDAGHAGGGVPPGPRR